MDLFWAQGQILARMRPELNEVVHRKSGSLNLQGRRNPDEAMRSVGAVEARGDKWTVVSASVQWLDRHPIAVVVRADRMKRERRSVRQE